VVGTFEMHGGSTKPKLGQLTVCWGPDEETALDTAMTWWPTAAVEGELMQELPLPRHFEQASQMVTKDQLRKVVVCGPDVSPYLEAIDAYAAAGYDHVFIHQVGTRSGEGSAVPCRGRCFQSCSNERRRRRPVDADLCPMKGGRRCPTSDRASRTRSSTRPSSARACPRNAPQRSQTLRRLEPRRQEVRVWWQFQARRDNGAEEGGGTEGWKGRSTKAIVVAGSVAVPQALRS
jgi:hypothetical protein